MPGPELFFLKALLLFSIIDAVEKRFFGEFFKKKFFFYFFQSALRDFYFFHHVREFHKFSVQFFELGFRFEKFLFCCRYFLFGFLFVHLTTPLTRRRRPQRFC